MINNQVCYFIDDSSKQYGMEPRISFGIYEYPKLYGGHVVSTLKLPETRLINGISFDKFESEKEFKRLPKNWSYKTQLCEVTFDEEKRNELKKAIGIVSIKDYSRIQYLFDHGYLIKRPDVEPRIEVEIDHGYYRIVKKYPAWTLVYGEHNTKYPNEVFETYDEAVKFLNDKNEKQKLRSIELKIIEAYETLDWLIDKYERDYGGKDIENVRQKILSMPRFYDYIYRYYDKKILMMLREDHGKNKEWKILELKG